MVKFGFFCEELMNDKKKILISEGYRHLAKNANQECLESYIDDITHFYHMKIVHKSECVNLIFHLCSISKKIHPSHTGLT